MSLLPLPILFVLAFAIALLVNYPSWEDQQKHLVSHAGSVVTVSTMIFAAGIFTGVLTGTKMIEAMAAAAVSVIPESLAGYLPVIVAVTSMPLSLVFTPDAYYFGVLPVLAQAAAQLRHRSRAGRPWRHPWPDDDRLPAQPAYRLDLHPDRA